MQELTIFEKLSLSTVRIECELPEGGISTGTGFFIRFLRSEKSYVPVIVTNKHVVDGAISGRIYFTLSDKSGNPKFGTHHKFEITDFQKPWLDHPNEKVDLCAMPINVLVEEMDKKGIKPYITFIDLETIPSQSDIDAMAGMEDIVMIGYPNGL